MLLGINSDFHIMRQMGNFISNQRSGFGEKKMEGILIMVLVTKVHHKLHKIIIVKLQFFPLRFQLDEHEGI